MLSHFFPSADIQYLSGSDSSPFEFRYTGDELASGMATSIIDRITWGSRCRDGGPGYAVVTDRQIP
jgi:hypothetical protein